jgi:5-methylcytosine-specific restriction endonuclease McrA
MKRWKSMKAAQKKKVILALGLDYDPEKDEHDYMAHLHLCDEKKWEEPAGKPWNRVANKYNSLHKAAYREYLKSNEWQHRRRQVLLRDAYVCRICGSEEDLHVHHLTYDRKFNEPLYDLVTVCEKCHKLIHLFG